MPADSRETSRPDPDALIAAAAREGRGRLKVFLGAAPGVGKTWEMLAGARIRRAEGVDVVIGVVETHGRAETQAQIGTLPVLPRPYGIRVRLKAGDPFAKLLGTDWQNTHWFFTAAERDRVLEDMSRKHEYSRIGDQPALVFEKVENLGESRSF